MIRKIIRFSAENRFLVVAASLLLLGLSFWSMQRIPLDALPDLSDTQVIVYSKWDRSPDLVEDQVTYPIITSLLGAPKVKAVRRKIQLMRQHVAQAGGIVDSDKQDFLTIYMQSLQEESPCEK